MSKGVAAARRVFLGTPMILALLRALPATGWALLATPALAAPCTQPLAHVVSVQGTVELRRAQSTEWSGLATDSALCPGDSVRVSRRSRAAVRLINESTLRLDQDTTLTLGKALENKTLIDLLRGAINVITRTPKPFEVRTPFVNAGVEGTEFLVRSDADEAQITVFEGKVRAANDGQTLSLIDGDVAVAHRNGLMRRRPAR